LKVEVRCGNCGRGYLVEEASIPSGGGVVPCQSCGAGIALRHAPAASPPPVPTPSAPEPEPAREVCCPRCSLHFVPDTNPKPRPAGRSTLLIVEDMEYFIEMARDALGGRYELKIARGLDEARAILRQGGIDLLLLDVTLQQGEDGLRLLREPPGKICPVLLYTAQDESEMYGEGWEKLKALGVDGVVIKGMNMDEMLSRKVAETLGEPLPQDAYRR
jgi:hypothetical protein